MIWDAAAFNMCQVFRMTLITKSVPSFSKQHKQNGQEAKTANIDLTSLFGK